MRPHTQLVNIDASWEKGHNRVFFSARNKFLYFIMLKIQQGLRYYRFSFEKVFKISQKVSICFCTFSQQNCVKR